MVNFLQLIIDKDANLNLNWEDDLVKGACITPTMAKLLTIE